MTHGIQDILAPDMQVLFCGINPGASTAHSGFHFAHPGNRFWKVIFLAGLTRIQLRPDQEQQLLDTGCGITMLVERPTTDASQIKAAELREGGERLMQKVAQWQPRALAVLGKGAFQQAFRQRNACWGLQPERAGATQIWVLPNPSGLNRASLEEMVRAFAAMRLALEAGTG